MTDRRHVQARKGSEAAFAVLVSEHQQAVRQFLRRLAANPADADDLAQEAFVTAWERIDRLQSGVSFRTFVCGIAWKKAQNDRRRIRRSETRDGAWLSLRSEAETPTHETRLSLDKAMQSLPLDMRAVISLCVAEDYSHAEAARILGLPLGTVKSHIQRGRARLCELLGVEP
ncbi:RNA polymerase sigma factor [Asticcacaulis excentricus]|uniref:RNA polymerase sigma-70 factor, ECF subfamily n=1 Tax=Asticcacaulis excentricus TaxID=78587 RepID=A0A3G9G3A9_9CAUL|nr:sigma-70 family RNA polymerase sigma factor [Asticcacaulis excentricus]BBF80355.1 RNA polymerase sigma-70 factor, ECF subfamily [Asticcacaulis excentricus]